MDWRCICKLRQIYRKPKSYRRSRHRMVQDTYKVWVDYALTVARSEDYKLGGQRLYRAGLKSLMWHVLGEDLPKRRVITLSRWDVDFLTDEQSAYACLMLTLRLSLPKTNQDQCFKIRRPAPAPAPLKNEGFNRYPQEYIKKSSKETNQDQVV
ncbi:hypothetical protein MKX03_012935 [Papaver bracteatum]|nr:hypothetical protein MKX03_012935 [Papaver bracteatum]